MFPLINDKFNTLIQSVENFKKFIERIKFDSNIQMEKFDLLTIFQVRRNYNSLKAPSVQLLNDLITKVNDVIKIINNCSSTRISYRTDNSANERKKELLKEQIKLINNFIINTIECVEMVQDRSQLFSTTFYNATTDSNLNSSQKSINTTEILPRPTIGYTKNAATKSSSNSSIIIINASQEEKKSSISNLEQERSSIESSVPQTSSISNALQSRTNNQPYDATYTQAESSLSVEVIEIEATTSNENQIPRGLNVLNSIESSDSDCYLIIDEQDILGGNLLKTTEMPVQKRKSILREHYMFITS